MITLKDIQTVCDQIVQKFQPDKVVLFGSFAYGQPNQDSDVDILVIMPAESEIRKAFEIKKSLTRSFALDLLVKTPEEVSWRYRGYDPLIRYALDEGKVLYDREWSGEAKGHPGVA